MEFGFSCVGLIFLIMLFAPNLIWTKNKPKNYDQHVKNEKRVLSMFESVGQVLVVCFSLIFSDYDVKVSSWLLFLILAFALMILYEIYWIRYFKSQKTMGDMYSSFLGIPVAGATLPVLAFFLLGIYGKNVFLIVATIILAIGHIGIHWNHSNEVNQ